MIVCVRCGTENRPGRKFCAQCSAPLPVSCPQCGAANEAGDRFCGECGAGLVPPEAAAAVAAPTGSRPSAVSRAGSAGARERKVATILFADLVGFTSLGESSDPELVQALVSRAFDRLSLEVERYEGLIEKFAGDAMLAVFGVPQSHEDDPERAVRAALEMQSAMAELAVALRTEGRPELMLRIGIESGEVLVDQGRAADERDRIVTGDPVNTAARLEALAQPGTVTVGPAAYAATRGRIEYEELAPAALKGKALRVPAWRAVSVKARRGSTREPLGLEAPLIGRDEELSLLKDTVRRSVAERKTHLVTVIGAAGIGKSRLTWELEKYLDGLPERYHWRKGRCFAYGQASYSAFAEAMKSDAGIRDDDTGEVADDKIQARIAELGSEPAGPAVDALLALLGRAPVDVPREELHEAWRRHIETIAESAPLLLVLEDIHWADEGLLDLTEFLARWSAAPLVILVLARHELLERRPAWGGGIPNATLVVLDALATDESAQLIDRILGAALPLEVRDRVAAFAEGNPLFAEELVRMFVDRGVVRFSDGAWRLAASIDAIEVPSSIQGVLAARLDGLPGAEKRLAQDAAVVGRIFWDAVVAHLGRQSRGAVGELLGHLRVKQLIVPREPSALSGAREYSFRHVLVRDVAYDSLPKRDRSARHLAVARWAETELGDRLEEFVELLADHYLSALRYEEEFEPSGPHLEALRRTALDHATRAGRRAGAVHQKETATRWFRIALDLSRKLGGSPVVVGRLVEEYMVPGFGYEPIDDQLRVLEAIVDGLATLELDDDGRQLLGRLRAWLGTVAAVAGRVDESRRVLEIGIAALEADPPTRALALLRGRLGWSYWRFGPAERAPAILERAVAEARSVRDRSSEGYALMELGVARWMLGDPRGSTPLLREALVIARETGDHALLIRCYVNLPGQMEEAGGDWQEAYELANEGHAVATRSLDRAAASWTAIVLAFLLGLRGRLREAIRCAEESVDWARSIGDVESLVARTRALAGWEWQRGERDRAIARLAEVAAAPHVDVPQDIVWRAVADAWLAWERDPPAALQIIATRLARATAHRGHGGVWLARMALRVGDPEALAQGVAIARDGWSGIEAGRVGLMRRWMMGLAEPDTTTAAAVVSSAVDELEALGYLGLAADAAADVALLAARAGEPSTELVARAQGLYGATDVVPVLGPLPETRWYTPQPTASAGAARDGP